MPTPTSACLFNLILGSMAVSLASCGGGGGSNPGGAAPPSAGASNGIYRVTRAETAVQGSGLAEQADPAPGTQVRRLTVGGHYLRRNDATSPSHKLVAGLHGNPTATQ